MSITTLVNLPENVAEVYGSIGWDALSLLSLVSIFSVVYWVFEIWASGKYGRSADRGPVQGMIHVIVTAFVIMASFGYGTLVSSALFSEMWDAMIKGSLQGGLPLPWAQFSAGVTYVGLAGVVAYTIYILHGAAARQLVWLNEYGYVDGEISREEIVMAMQNGHMSSFGLDDLATRVRNRTGAVGGILLIVVLPLSIIYAIGGLAIAPGLVATNIYLASMLFILAIIAETTRTVHRYGVELASA
jgi:hypothetical protein